jgi:hypothetical protein
MGLLFGCEKPKQQPADDLAMTFKIFRHARFMKNKATVLDRKREEKFDNGGWR